jgi:hypothetical protein
MYENTETVLCMNSEIKFQSPLLEPSYLKFKTQKTE